MTKISTYVVDDKVTALDKWIGSDANMQNKTKNFTPKKLAAYFNENQVINIGTPLQYKYYTLDPLEQRPNGTLTFETEIGPTVNFSSITTFLLSKYTTKQNIVSDFLNFLDGSKVLLFKSSDINSFGFYRISSIEPYEPDPNFFVVTVDYETGNGALEEDEDYMISLVSLAGDFIPTKTSELINDGDDGVNPFISELDINRTEWDEAYDSKINSAEVTGDTTKTLTLTKQDGSTIEASWTDDNTDAVTSVFGRDGDVVAETGDYNTDKVTEGDNLYFTESRSRSSVSLTTTGSNGEATYDSVTGVFNIPNYSEDLVDYVPYTGATKDVNLGIHQLKADSLAVSITSAEAVDIGGIVWNQIDGTFDMGLIGGVTLQAGQELHMYGKATEAISNGQAVMFAGVQGDHILVAKADATTINANPEYLIGIATQNFSNNQFGYVTVFGNVRGLDTTAYTLGSVLYYDSTTATDGLLTATEPTAPNAKIIVAAVVRVHATQGILLVRPHVMPKLKDIQDVYAPSPSDKNGLFWNNTNSRYENNSISGILGYTPANDSSVVKLTGVQTIGGIKIFSESTKFDYGVYLKQDGVTASFPGYTTIDGTTNGYVVTNGDGRTAFFNLANVTSLGYTYPSTSGTFALTSDLHSPVTIGTANGLSLSGQQLSLGLASSTLNGALSSTDWNTFNNKQTAGNYITSLTGEVTASGPGAASATLNNASVTAKVLSGVNITGGTILDTDTMLTAFGKLQNQINSLIGGSIYQGVWNASTNTPTLTSSVGTDGYYYIVNVAGSTNLNGITDWKVGDWAIFHGGTWQKVDNTDAVSSVNGFTGAVSLTTDNISEGVTNQYFLNSRARAALSFAAGSGAYNSTTGVITIPTNNNQITNGSNFITLASLSGSAPIQYNNTTGAISITQAGASSNGFLSSTDWNTFNNKLSSLSGAVLTTTDQTITGTKTFTNTIGINTTGVSISLNSISTGLEIIADGSTSSNRNISFKVGSTLAAIINSSGNVGIGVMPKNWDSLYKVLQISDAALTGTIDGVSMSHNLWQNGETPTYITSRPASSYSQNSGNHYWDTAPSGTANNGMTLTTRMILTNAGNVGIGTISPVSYSGYNTLTINGSIGGVLAIRNASNIGLNLYSTAAGGHITAIDATKALIFETADIERMRITSGGNVEIKNSDSRLLGGNTSGRLIVSNSDTSAYVSINGSANATPNNIGIITNSQITFNTGASYSEAMRIFSSGNVFIGPSPSDAGFRLDVNGTGRFATSLTVGAGGLAGRLSVRGTTNDSSAFAFEAANSSGNSLLLVRNDGNVGIGTTSPSTLFHIYKASFPILTIQSSSYQSSLGIDTTSGNLVLNNESNAPLSFNTNATERMRITSGGNVTIGDSSTNNTGKFNYASAGVGAYNGVLELYHSTSNISGSGFMNFYINNSVIGSIGQSGTTGVTYNTTSDYRLKEDFKDYSGLDLVSQIKTYDYKWKSSEDRMYGVKAHELQEVIPYAVTGEKDGEQMQGVDYSKLVPILVQAIQELKSEIEILKNK